MRRVAVLVGAEGHAVSLTESVTAAGFEIIAYTSDRTAGGTLLDRPVWEDVPAAHVDSGGIVVLAIGDNATRERLWNQLIQRVPREQFPAIVHPTASVSTLATIGPGSVVLQGAVVCSGARVGVGCLLNSGSILEHESAMDDFASLAPGAVIGGRVRIGARTAVSIGAVIKHGLTLGADSVIGAASYVHSDVPEGVVAFGVPARVMRKRHRGDTYL